MPDLKIVVSDVKEAHQAFGLMKDKHSCIHCSGDGSQLKPSIFCYLNSTIRLLRYDHLYNAQTNKSLKIDDIKKD